MKIKTTKTMNLPELIQWAWDNDVKIKTYILDQNSQAGVKFDNNNRFFLHDADFINPTNTFTVEVEEEITEDTVLPEIVELYETYSNNNVIDKYKKTSISEIKDEGHCVSQAFYILNDDLTMTLIWRDGKLIEE